MIKFDIEVKKGFPESWFLLCSCLISCLLTLVSSTLMWSCFWHFLLAFTSAATTPID